MFIFIMELKIVVDLEMYLLLFPSIENKLKDKLFAKCNFQVIKYKWS